MRCQVPDEVSPGPTGDAPRLLLVVTEDWYFLSHRLPLALAARDAGYDVWVATRPGTRAREITDAGLHLVSFQLDRSSLRPDRALAGVWALWRILRRVRPRLVHNVALKPCLLGTCAGRLAGVPVLNTFGGLGYLFFARGWKHRVVRTLVRFWLRLWFRGKSVRTVVQNPETFERLQASLPASTLRLVRGSGVDVEHFHALPEPAHSDPSAAALPPTVALVGRMLRDKGVVEFVEALRLLRDRGFAVDGQPVRGLLAGRRDPVNPACLDEITLQRWQDEGLVEWRGEVADVREVWAESLLAVLPSYHEGLPKSLLEAAACERALIATDIPGCREIAQPEVSGVLVPVRDAAALADALEALLSDPERRRRLAAGARELVCRELSQDVVHRQTLELYAELLRTSGEVQA